MAHEGLQSDREALRNLFNRRTFPPIFVPTLHNEIPHVVCQAPLFGDLTVMTTRADIPLSDSVVDLELG